MTVQDYENQGGFKEELRHVREIGFTITMLKDMIPARPNRHPEIVALKNLSICLDALREEIGRTRNT